MHQVIENPCSLISFVPPFLFSIQGPKNILRLNFGIFSICDMNLQILIGINGHKNDVKLYHCWPHILELADEKTIRNFCVGHPRIKMILSANIPAYPLFLGARREEPLEASWKVPLDFSIGQKSRIVRARKNNQYC